VAADTGTGPEDLTLVDRVGDRNRLSDIDSEGVGVGCKFVCQRDADIAVNPLEHFD